MMIENCKVDDCHRRLLVAEIEQLRAENIKVSCHCAALIQVMRDHDISDDTIKAIADEQRAVLTTTEGR